MVVYGVTTADCDVRNTTTVSDAEEKDVFVTYMAWINLILFISLGTSAVSNVFDMGENGAAEQGKKSISIVKFVDSIIRFVGVLYFLYIAKLDTEDVPSDVAHIPTNVSNTTSHYSAFQNINETCTEISTGLLNGTTTGTLHFTEYNRKSLALAAFGIVIVEMVIRLGFIAVRTLSRDWINDEDNQKIVKTLSFFEYVCTVAGHVTVGLLVSWLIQSNVYEYCEVYDKKAEYRATVGLFLASLFTSLLHIQTLRLEWNIKDDSHFTFEGLRGYLAPFSSMMSNSYF
jgi:hypothetical protein